MERSKLLVTDKIGTPSNMKGWWSLCRPDLLENVF